MEKRCFACMNMTDTDVCRYCGHNNADPGVGQEQFLRPGTIVNGRYYVGIPIDRNGEGITYVAFDNQEKARVRLREFFPGALCLRDSARKYILVNQGSEIQFKALMTDFVELSRQLIALPSNNCLLQAKDIFADNNTIYTVYEDVEAITLNQYLKEHAGQLSWDETESMFLPLLYTVKLLNAKRIVHRGISPDTILVTRHNELKLKGICTSAVRAINTEIKPELFAGYAAPEQYEKCASHGEWTDVYAVCAVLYRVLTGSMPPRADIRGIDSRLVSPADLESSVPVTISKAIMKGLEVGRSRRTQYIKDLIGDLYASSGPEISRPQRILDEEDEVEEDLDHKPKKHKMKFHMPVWLLVILITLPLMLILFFLAYALVLGPSEPAQTSSLPSSALSSELSSDLSSEEPSSKETSSNAQQVSVDDFTGKYYDDVIKSDFYKKLFKFKDKIEEYDDIVPSGQIIKQDVPQNSVVDQGTEIQFTVSKGPQYVVIPPLTDENSNAIELDAYKKYFTDRGIEVNVITEDNYDVPSGQIIRLDRTVGERLDREKVSAITIYVAR